jgi:pimeloyl-ACP methyl ester carboxylesterase
MLLLDAASTTDWRANPSFWVDGGVRLDMKDTEWEASGRLRPSVPLLVLSAGANMTGSWPSRQDALARLSPHSVHVVAAKSHHVVQLWNPGIVAAAVSMVWAAAKGGKHLPSCESRAGFWDNLGGYCH